MWCNTGSCYIPIHKLDWIGLRPDPHPSWFSQNGAGLNDGQVKVLTESTSSGSGLHELGQTGLTPSQKQGGFRWLWSSCKTLTVYKYTWLNIPTMSSTIVSSWGRFFQILKHWYFPASDSCMLEILNEMFPFFSSFMTRLVLYSKAGCFISKVSQPSRYRKMTSGYRPSLDHSTVGMSLLTVMRKLHGRMTSSPTYATTFSGKTGTEELPRENENRTTLKHKIKHYEHTLCNAYHVIQRCLSNVMDT